MLIPRVFIVLLFAGIALCSYSTIEPRLDSNRVLILYDGTFTVDEDLNGVQDSLQLAQYYAAARGVPMANLIEINYTTANPTLTEVKAVLLQKVIDKLDSIGPNNIDVMVVMWPLPIAASEASVSRTDISIDTVLMRPYKFYSDEATVASSGLFRNNEKNPYFHRNPTYSPDFPRFDRSNPDLEISRIDGPYGLYNKLNLISNAIYADKFIDRDNFWGNVYIDTRAIGPGDLEAIRARPNVNSGNCYEAADGDGCIASVITLLQNLSLPYQWENNPPVIGEAGTFWNDGSPAITAPDALFYSGWYSHNFYVDVWSYLPGAFACDLNSDSFTSVRIPRLVTSSGSKSLEAGATCVSGSIGEPILEAHPRGSTTIYYLLRGYSYAEAASLGTFYLGWNSLNIGDPLYQPLSAKEAAIDNDTPTVESFDIKHNPNEGHWVDLVLSGVETAQMTFKYGILSVEEHSLTSRYHKKFHKEYIGELQSTTQYQYQAILVDPKGNTFTTSIGTFVTPERRTYMNQTYMLPGQLESVYYDQGGDGIGSFSAANKPFFHWSRPDSAIDTRIYDLATYYMRHQNWMKYTVNITSSGIYSVTWTMVLPLWDVFNVTFYLDGQQIGEPGSIPARADSNPITVILNNVQLAAGEHILKVLLTDRTYNDTIATTLFTDVMRQLEFTLVSALEDASAPTITKLNSQETAFYFIEQVQFADDLHVWYVEVWVNGELAATYKELTADGVMTFHIPKTILQLGDNIVVLKAFDSTSKQSEQQFAYQLSVVTVPDGTVITPDGTQITPDGTKVTPNGQIKTSSAHLLAIRTFALMALFIYILI